MAKEYHLENSKVLSISTNAILLFSQRHTILSPTESSIQLYAKQDVLLQMFQFQMSLAFRTVQNSVNTITSLE